MGKILSIIIGAVVLVVGFLSLLRWWSDFLFVLRGTIPLILIFCGVIAVLSGINELKDTIKVKSTK